MFISNAIFRPDLTNTVYCIFVVVVAVKKSSRSNFIGEEESHSVDDASQFMSGEHLDTASVEKNACFSIYKAYSIHI